MKDGSIIKEKGNRNLKNEKNIFFKKNNLILILNLTIFKSLK